MNPTVGAASLILFEARLNVDSVDSSSFDRVSRVVASAPQKGHPVTLTLDVNTAIYPLREGDNIHLLLTKDVELSPAPAGLEDDGAYDPNMRRRETLLDSYEYAMYGRVFKFEEDPKDPHRVAAFASFGGLLMNLRAPPASLDRLFVDQALYVLVSMEK